MMNVHITDEFKRTVSFEELVKDTEDPIACACEYADLSYWKEYCGSTNTFTIFADTKDELEEKTLDLISDIEHKARNRVITIENGEVIVKGFDIESMKRHYQNHYDIVIAWGHKGTWNSPQEVMASRVQENYIEFEDEESGCEMVLFFNTYDDIFGEMSEEDKKVYEEDYPLNTEAQKYGLEDDKAYGEITLLTKDFAETFLSFE